MTKDGSDQCTKGRVSVRGAPVTASKSCARVEIFLGIVAHELRNPLASIASGLQILALSPDGPESSKVRQLMERQVAHLSRVVDDLLDMSRANQAKLSFTKAPARLSEIVSLALEMARSSISRGNHGLTVEMPEYPGELIVDANRISQALSNLLDNAAKYTPYGGEISLRVSAEEQNIVISVADNGVGIAREHQQSIFTHYMQVDSSQELARGGLGLGLYLVKMIVEGHGGSIEVRSDGAGKGSEFVVRLPINATGAKENGD
jgi:signal transduction histidine kinase